VQALFEEGTLVRNGAIKLDTLKVATTVQAILAAHPLIYCAPGGFESHSDPRSYALSS